MNGHEKLTDAELAAAAQRGDALAESALVRRYSSLADGISRSYFLTSGIWKNSGYFTSWSSVVVVPARRAEAQMAAGL